MEDTNCGCRGCSSGEQGEKNIFGNKYGQYLAGIQVRRERKQAKLEAAEAAAAKSEGGVWAERGGGEDDDDEEEEDDEEEDEEGGGGREEGEVEKVRAGGHGQ